MDEEAAEREMRERAAVAMARQMNSEDRAKQQAMLRDLKDRLAHMERMAG